MWQQRLAFLGHWTSGAAHRICGFNAPCLRRGGTETGMRTPFLMGALLRNVCLATVGAAPELLSVFCLFVQGKDMREGFLCFRV